MPGVLVVAEPAPVNALLLADGRRRRRTRVACCLVRALGRRRFGDERHYVLKLSSWNVRRFALFRRAFPAAPPRSGCSASREEVVASLLADPPGWLALRRDPDAARAFFGIDAAPADEPRLFHSARSRRCFEAAPRLGRRPGARLCRPARVGLDASAAPLIGLALGADDIARMAGEARYSAKDPAPPALYRRISPRAAPAPALRARVAAGLDPLYAAPRSGEGICPAAARL